MRMKDRLDLLSDEPKRTNFWRFSELRLEHESGPARPSVRWTKTDKFLSFFGAPSRTRIRTCSTFCPVGQNGQISGVFRSSISNTNPHLFAHLPVGPTRTTYWHFSELHLELESATSLSSVRFAKTDKFLDAFRALSLSLIRTLFLTSILLFPCPLFA